MAQYSSQPPKMTRASSSVVRLKISLPDGPPSSGSYRRIHDLRACSAAPAAPYCGAKRRAVSYQAEAPSATRSEEQSGIQIRSVRWLDRDNGLLCCSSRTLPAWGAKGARSALGGGGKQIPAICGAKRAISATKWRGWTDLGGSSRRIHDLRAYSTARTAPYCGAKRRAVSYQAQTPTAKRPRSRILHDPATKEESCIQIRSVRWLDVGNGLPYCLSHSLPAWGAKGARSSLRGGGTQIPPICGAKQARSATKWRDWTDLSQGPAGLIAERLLANDVADYVSFRAVCRPWRLCAPDPQKHGIMDRRFHPRQWIMLRESRATPCRPRFMNVSTGYCRFVDLPELSSHDMFPTAEGFLVLLHRTSYAVRLLNPITRQATDLPVATTLLLEQDNPDNDQTRDLLAVTGAGLADESTIAVIFGSIHTLAVAKPGDAHWTVVDRGNSLGPALSLSGRFYCYSGGAIKVVKISADCPPRLAIAAKCNGHVWVSGMMMSSAHLVDNDGELMLVNRHVISNGEVCGKCKVYRVDLDARKIVRVNRLGGRAVFMGMERALSVSPSVFPSINADAIYFGFDPQLTCKLDYSPFRLVDGTAKPRCTFDNSSCGPWGIDDYLSWFVTGYFIINGLEFI